MNIKEIEDIVKKAYPKIVKDLGIGKRGIPEIELHVDIYARLSGDPKSRGEGSKTTKAEFDYDKIYIYHPNMKTEEDVLRSLLHEHKHTLQDRSKEKEYRARGYDNNPHEIEARKVERLWRKYKRR